jgi:hypothetical protein
MTSALTTETQNNAPTEAEMFKAQVLSIIGDTISSIDDELNEAKIQFADSNMNEAYKDSFRYRDKVNLIQGKKDILKELRVAVEKL